MFGRLSVMRGLFEVSQARLQRTLYTEYPEVQEFVNRLSGDQPGFSLDALTRIWGVDHDTRDEVAEKLVSLGFFLRKRSSQQPEYLVAPIYRPAMEMPLQQPEPFLPFGRGVIDAASRILAERMPTATVLDHPLSEIARFPGAETTIVRFQQRGGHGALYIQLVAAQSDTRLALRGASHVIYARLLDRHRVDVDRESYPGLAGTQFQWMRHSGSEQVGYRACLRYDEVQGLPVAMVGSELADMVCTSLVSAGVLPTDAPGLGPRTPGGS